MAARRALDAVGRGHEVQEGRNRAVGAGLGPNLNPLDPPRCTPRGTQDGPGRARNATREKLMLEEGKEEATVSTLGWLVLGCGGGGRRQRRGR